MRKVERHSFSYIDSDLLYGRGFQSLGERGSSGRGDDAYGSSGSTEMIRHLVRR